MSAVSQSYPNYLGGLNEQPDELKKPGQLSEALNVTPDPTIGLCRRPGFKQLNRLTGVDPKGTWFNFDLDQHYIGCINLDGTVRVFDENGDARIVKTLDPLAPEGGGILPHKKYQLTEDAFIVEDDEGQTLASYDQYTDVINYFKHTNDQPLKYCVSKNHIVVTNPTQQPVLSAAVVPTTSQSRRYYSFINLKLIDTENYNYTFKRFYGKEGQDSEVITFNSIKEIELDEAFDLDNDYESDLTQPWNGEVRNITLQPNDPSAKEQDPAEVKVTFRTQVVTFKSKDGDGFPTRVRHFWDVSIVSAGKGFKPGVITVTEPGLDGGADVVLTFNITETRKVTSVDFDDITISTENNNDAESILQALSEQFTAKGIDKVRVVGNGIYLENNIPFSVSTAEVAVADVVNSQKLEDALTGINDRVPIVRVNSVSELPIECYEGFIVQVRNSFDGKNDYYLQYVSESTQADGDNVTLEKADGFWEEIAKPFEPVNPKNYSMPHLITAVENGETGEYAFIVSRMLYERRTAGDIADNPSLFGDNAKITAIEYYKNRLFFLTDIGTVVTSRAGKINNMHINTALSTSPIDPIDVPASTSSRVPIHGSSVVNNGLVLFGDNEQYSLNTNQDILSSNTVNLTKIANYTFEPNSYPIYLGTNIGFISGGFSRFYEMTNVYDRGPVDINERSQQVQMMFGQGFNMLSSSREQSQVIAYKRYSGYVQGSPDMMLYRFRQESSQDSSQTSWVRWRLGGKRVAHVTMPQDKMYVAAVDSAERVYLWLMDSSSITGLPANGASLSVVPKFTDGWTDNEDGDKFKTSIRFPTIYAGSSAKMDITANLTIHRVKLSTAAIGTYDLTIDRKGYDTYKLLVEQTPADEYKANFPQLYGERIETIPVYTRNKNLTLTMSTDYDAPLTLRSMTWEGDYNRPYYKSV